MMRNLTFALTLTLLIAISGVAMTQPSGERKALDDKAAISPAISARPAIGMVAGKVTQVDNVAKTLTVTSSNGQVITLSAADLKVLPEVGEVVEVIYSKAEGMGKALRSTKSSTSE